MKQTHSVPYLKKPYLTCSTFLIHKMSDNPIVSGGRARRVINMNIPEDVSYWTAKWRITPEQLQAAVNYVGGKETRVLDYLRYKGYVRY